MWLSLDCFQWENTVGQDSTGYAFDVKSETEGKPISVSMAWNAMVRYDVIAALMYGTAENSIDNKNYTIVYNPQQSSAKLAKFILAYDDEQDGQDASAESGRQGQNKHRGSQESRESSDNAAIASSSSPDSTQRRQQFLRKAAAGIQGESLSDSLLKNDLLESQKVDNIVLTYSFIFRQLHSSSRHVRPI